MSLKDLFESTKTLQSSSADQISYDAESEAYVESYIIDKDTFVPSVDFSSASNFAKFGSAEKYYADAITRIHDQYPYDGSHFEKVAFRVTSSYLDQWVFDNRYPRTTGYVELGTTSGSQDWLPMVSASNAVWGVNGPVGGYGMPHTIAYDANGNNIFEYIEIRGGPHTGSADRTFEVQESSLKKMWDYSNVFDSGSARESNLDFNLDNGVTVEFWMLKNAFYTNKTEREVVFDLWNNENSSSAGYGRLMIELSGGSDAGSSIRLTAQSGTTGFVNEPIASITPSQIADGVWKHYAVTFKNSDDGDGINAALYINGAVSGSAKFGSATIGRVTGSLVANLGALTAPPSGATGYYDTTTIAKGGAKLSASLDEFRFWKLERDPRQISRYWWQQVGGGTNTDKANVGLGVYYKFNEGIMHSASRDTTILDYSGRISNGIWHGGVSECRNSGSAFASGSHNMNEFHDPIIYSTHESIVDLKVELEKSGSYWDQQNNAMLFSNFPSWTTQEFGEDSDALRELTQIMGSYFDKLYLQIDALGKIKDRYSNAYTQNVHSASHKPIPFADKLVKQMGIATPEILQEAEFIENFLNRSENKAYGEKIADVRNQIYSNIYANLLHVFKSKGTEKSFRNMIRCFGIDDELVKLNMYADNSDYVFKDNRRATSNRTNYISFAHTDRFAGTVYQGISSSEGVYSNPNAAPYITGSSTFGKYLPQTLEAEIFFPEKPGKDQANLWYQDEWLTGSMFGCQEAVESLTDYGWQGNTLDNKADIRVQVVKDQKESKRARFQITSSVFGLLTSSYYEDVYDDTRWNFAVRIKPEKYPWTNQVSGTLVTGSVGDVGAANYIVEFYGVNVFSDIIQHEFLVSASMTTTQGEQMLSAPKRCYVGALHTGFTGSSVYDTEGGYSNVEVGNFRYWMSYLSDKTVKTHAFDESSFGTESPYENVFLFQTDMSGVYVPQVETLALHWNFDNVTGSGVSPSLGHDDHLPQQDRTENASDAQFIVQDMSSGSAEHCDRYGADFSPRVKMQHIGIGDFFLGEDKKLANTRYIATAKTVLPEYVHSSDMVEIRQRDDEFFTNDTRPSSFFYAIEKSMYQTISEEMVKIFASIKDFDNLIGEPVNRYRHEYKDLAKLRQLFFERFPNTPDLDKYVDYYKWIDNAIARFLEQLMPASARHSEGLRTMVESHILERNKYQTKFPTMEFYGDPPEACTEGINKLLYDYKRGSAPLPDDVISRSPVSTGSGSAEMQDQSDSCLWWNKRAEREHPVLSASLDTDAGVGNILPSGAMHSRIGIFSASQQTFTRNWCTPYRYTVDSRTVVHGGINFDDNKKLDYVYPATRPFSPRPLDYHIFGGYPLGYLLAKDMDRDASPSASLADCDLPTSSSWGRVVKREGYKVIDGWETFRSNTSGESSTPSWESASYTTFRGNLVMPFNVVSSSQHDVNAGYTQLINQDLTVFKGTGVGHPNTAGTYVNKRRGPVGLDSDENPTKVGGLGRGVNLVNLHTDTYGEDKEVPMQGPFTEKYVGGRRYRHADVNDGTDTLSTRQEGFFVLVSTALSNSSGVFHANSGGVGLTGPDYPYPHGPYPFAANDAVNWRPIGGRLYRDETAKRPVNIRNIQMQTSSVEYATINEHRVDVVGTDGDAEGDWTKTYHEQIVTGSARTIIGNYKKNYEIVHTVGRSNQKPFLRDNQSVRNITQTGSLPASTHVESILTTRTQAITDWTFGAIAKGIIFRVEDTNLGARVIVADKTAGGAGVDDVKTFTEHAVQDRSSGSTNLDTIFANRFSAPGGPRNQSKGYLDMAAEEYSVYNAYNFRNLEVLGSSSGEYNFISASIHDVAGHPRLGLRSLRALPMGKFGVAGVLNQTTKLQDHSHDYLTDASWHKVHRNARLEHRAIAGNDHTVVDGARVEGETNYVEKTVYDNDYVTRPIPRSDFQYSWISASLAPSSSNSSLSNLGHGYHYDWDQKPTATGSSPTDPMLFISSSVAGFAYVNDARASTQSLDVGLGGRAFGNRDANATQFTPVVHNLNLGIYEPQNTWLTDASGALALGWFHEGMGGVQAADEKPIWGPTRGGIGVGMSNTEHDTIWFAQGSILNRAGPYGTEVNVAAHGIYGGKFSFPRPTAYYQNGFAGSSLIGGIWNYVNLWESSASLADNDLDAGIDTAHAMVETWVSSSGPMQGMKFEFNILSNANSWPASASWMDLERAHTGEVIGGDRAYNHVAPFDPSNVGLPLWRHVALHYPSIYSGSVVGNQDYEFKQSVATIFNGLMYKRNGPYGYPTWRQIRTGDHSLARTMRKENRIVTIDPVTSPVPVDVTPPGQSPGSGPQGKLSRREQARRRLKSVTMRDERKLNHYRVPAIDATSMPLITAVQKGPLGLSVDIDNTFHVLSTHENSQKNFPVPALNTDLGLEEHNTDRTAYSDLYQLYTTHKNIAGDYAYSLVNLVYRKQIFPKAENVGFKQYRMRDRYDVGYWAAHPEKEKVALNDESHRLGYYDPVGRRSRIVLGENTSRRQQRRHYVGASAGTKTVWVDFANYHAITEGRDQGHYDKDEKSMLTTQNRFISSWPMDTSVSRSVAGQHERYGDGFDQINDRDRTTSTPGALHAQWGAPYVTGSILLPWIDYGATTLSGTMSDYGGDLLRFGGSEGGGELNNNWSIFHNGIWLGAVGLSSDGGNIWKQTGKKVYAYNEARDDGDTKVERYVTRPAVFLSFAPLYSRPHTLVGRDSYCSPSAGLAAYSRRFIFNEANGSGKGKGKNITSVYPGLDGSAAVTVSHTGSHPLYDYRGIVAELTRSIGHAVEGLYCSDTPWSAPEQSGKAPFYKHYAEFFEDIKGQSVNRQIIPEYRISDRVEYYVLDRGGDFTKEDREWLTIFGNPSSSLGGPLTGSLHETGTPIDHIQDPEVVRHDRGAMGDGATEGRFGEFITSENYMTPRTSRGNLSNVTASFMKDYVVSAKPDLFATITNDHKGIAEPFKLTIGIDAILKFLPYQGFYPQLRTVDLCDQFIASYDKHVDFEARIDKDYANYVLPDGDTFITGNFDFASITDRTCPRVAGSGELLDLGQESHGRNAIAAKRPFYAPFMAPGILFNTIKSGVAVDYPVLNHALAVTASVDRDGGRNYQINNEYFDNRVPFEAILEPERIAGMPLIDMECHPSAAINTTASFDGNGDPLYKMMAHNFVAEIPNFFLVNGGMKTFVSLPESHPSFGQVATVQDGGLDIIPEYRMMVKLWKSQNIQKIDSNMPPSASNHWVNHRGPMLEVKTKTVGGHTSGSLKYLGKYEPCYMTDFIRLDQRDGNSAEGNNTTQGAGAFEYDEYRTPFGVDYEKAVYTYPRPQINSPETITMYSRPTAFGPPCAGGYAFEPVREMIYTGSAAPIAFIGDTLGNDPADPTPRHLPDTIAERQNTTWGMKDSTNGYNAPFTPPYYDGQAWALVTFKPTRPGKYTLDEIWEETTVNYLRYEFNYESGAYGDWGTFGPQGLAMNVNAMQIDSTVNLFGRTEIAEVEYEALTGRPLTIAKSLAKDTLLSAWTIQPKLETPILHFGYGETDNQTAPTLSGSDAAGSLAESNGYYPGFPGLTEPIGMWHQYGEIPSSSQGIYLEIADIPDTYIRNGTELTIANPKWLHITGSPDPNAGCTAGTHHAPDWDGVFNDSDGQFDGNATGSFTWAASVKTNLWGYGYRFSGSFSGSEESYIVGQTTRQDQDGVYNKTLLNNSQQFMRWRLSATGALAGLVADRHHLQIISVEDNTILDTTWGGSSDNHPVGTPGLSGAVDSFERGFYLNTNVTGGNIADKSDLAFGSHPGTSSARQYIMGVGALARSYDGLNISFNQSAMDNASASIAGQISDSYAHPNIAVTWNTYLDQFASHDNASPAATRQVASRGYKSPLHKNKRGIIPHEPHFTNNISTGSFGTDLGLGKITIEIPCFQNNYQGGAQNASIPVSGANGVGGQIASVSGYTSSLRQPGVAYSLAINAGHSEEATIVIDRPLSGSLSEYPCGNSKVGFNGGSMWRSFSLSYAPQGDPSAVQGYHTTDSGGNAMTNAQMTANIANGLTDIFPVGVSGSNGVGRITEINRWYKNTVYIANLRMADVGNRVLPLIGPDEPAATPDNPLGIPSVTHEALCSPRTVPSGKFLPRMGNPILTGSLADLVGFSKEPQKLGELAKTKVVKESVVVMPYVVLGGARRFIKLDRDQINRYYKRGKYKDVTTWRNAEVAMKLTGTTTSPISGLQVNLGTSVLRQMRLMDEYVFPPHLDFIRNASAMPFAMYIFEFEHTFDQQDMSDIWQGLLPDSAKIARRVTKNVSHELQLHELFGETQKRDGDRLPKDLRFMVFKVKQRAEINYYAKTSDSTDDQRFKFKFENGATERKTDWSYNWPYDFFSLVENAKIDLSVSIKNTNLITDVTLIDLDHEIEQEKAPEVVEVVDAAEKDTSGFPTRVSGIAKEASRRLELEEVKKETITKEVKEAVKGGMVKTGVVYDTDDDGGNPPSDDGTKKAGPVDWQPKDFSPADVEDFDGGDMGDDGGDGGFGGGGGYM